MLRIPATAAAFDRLYGVCLFKNIQGRLSFFRAAKAKHADTALRYPPHFVFSGQARHLREKSLTYLLQHKDRDVQRLLYAGLDKHLIRSDLMAGILICDDNSNIRYLLRVFIETKTPFKVCGEADNGTEVIEKARHLQPDLILLDLSMPVMTGAEAASLLKRMLPETKIILFSMHMDSVPRSLAAKIGVDLALSKSDGITKLGEHLKTLLAPAVPPVADTEMTPEARAVATQKPV